MIHCNARTMVKVALALGGIVAAAAVALPQARELLLAAAPLLLALVCPISMIAMALMMRRSPEQPRAAHAETAAPAAPGAALNAAPPVSSCSRTGSRQPQA